MDDLSFVSKIQKIMVSGAVDNMEKYQYMLGQVRTYQYLNQEISSLLNKKEQKENEGTVVNIGAKSNSTK